MKVCVVAEFYPRAADPVLGIWTHHQALAARAAGAEVRVVVLHRPIPAAMAARDPAAWRRAIAQPLRTTLDGLDIHYVPYLSPSRSRHYGHWGAYAAPPLATALRLLRRRFPFDLVHAHNAVPAADAVLRARLQTPLVVSVHGGDVLFTARHSAAWRQIVERAYRRARLVIANSAGIERIVQEHGAQPTRVVHLGTDLPALVPDSQREDAIVTVAHLVERKRHADVIDALALLADRRPGLRYIVIGDGPQRDALAAQIDRLGLADRVELTGQLPHREALARARRCRAFVMPSTDEAFGVAYIEAMAGGLPAIGAAGEPGPQEIAAAGAGIVSVPPRDPVALASAIDAVLDDDAGDGAGDRGAGIQLGGVRHGHPRRVCQRP